ncbi:S-protein homolog 5-like [Lycium ferocissimum]|uniref:S-protein homolog 5-like n=1 Tax=Lycium ferocissimum TaxID=112874 RepID=UPI00281602FE|nr:S-protein homolog 5-like [Lycium ferocissimum]
MSSPCESKYLFFILFLLFNYIHLINGFSFNPKFTVVIRNNLPENSDKLEFRVQSGDDDFGLRPLDVNKEFNFSFHWSTWGDTLFFSHFYWGSKQQILDVFNKDLPCAFKYEHGLCLWVVKESGFYLAVNTLNPSPQDLHNKGGWESNNV